MQTIDLKQFPINHLDLHGETLITAIEIEVSAFEMEALIKSNPDKPETMTSSYIRSFYNSLSSKTPICVGVSDELKLKLKKDLVGKFLKFNQHAQPISIINNKDILDIENVKNDFKFDNKASAITNTNLKYKLHLYYIYDYSFLKVSW